MYPALGVVISSKSAFNILHRVALASQLLFLSFESFEEFFSVHRLTAFQGNPALIDFLVRLPNLKLPNPIPLLKHSGTMPLFEEGIALVSVKVNIKR